MVLSEASSLSTIEEAEAIIEGALSTAEEVKVATKVPSLVDVEVIPLEGGSLARGHVEVPSPSWALEPSNNAAEVEVTLVSM